LKTGVIGFIGSKNIGDYIQTKAVIDILNNKKIKILDREKLNSYSDEEIKTIINGWYMQNPKNWPPSKSIFPLFISFHINPMAQPIMLSDKSLEYLKNYEPIGCRDNFTREVLSKKGIKAYYSSCVTTTFRRENYLESSNNPDGILIIGPFDRLKPEINKNSFFHLAISLIKYPFKAIKYHFNLNKLNKYLKKFSTTIKSHDQITESKIKTHEHGLKLATEMLKKIAGSEILITSRIHSAIPAAAMGLKVIFIDEGLNHINHQSRIKDLKNFFQCVSLKEFFMINLDDVRKRSDHLSFAKNLKKNIKTFIEE